MDLFWQQVINGLTLGSTYALIALGYTLIFGVLNIVNMAHGEIFMFGAFVGLVLATKFNLNIFLAMAGAMMFGAVLGYLLEKMALRPLRRRSSSHLAPLISTIGVAIFLESLALRIFGPQAQSFPPIFAGGLLDFGLFKISLVQIMILAISFGLMLVLRFWLDRTRVGKSIRATAESVETAGLLGINTGKVIVLTVMLASGLGAVAGVLVGLAFNAVEPTMGVTMGFKGLAVLILGGLGNITGAMVGGLILGVAEVFTVAYGGLVVPRRGGVWLDYFPAVPPPPRAFWQQGPAGGTLGYGVLVESLLSANRHVYHYQCHFGHQHLSYALDRPVIAGQCRIYEHRRLYFSLVDDQGRLADLSFHPRRRSRRLPDGDGHRHPNHPVAGNLSGHSHPRLRRSRARHYPQSQNYQWGPGLVRHPFDQRSHRQDPDLARD